MRDVAFWYDEEMSWDSQSVTLSSSSSEELTFSFVQTQTAIYLDDGKVCTQPGAIHPRLQVQDWNLSLCDH
jgi:hypothetical protein